MSFSTIFFIFYFLPISLSLFYIVNRFIPKFNDIYLLIISIIFYLWNDITIGFYFIFGAIIIYLCGLLLNKYKSKILLNLVIILLILLLVYFKYSDYFVLTINRIFNKDLDLIYLSLPLGLSFAIFEAITYLVDVYNGCSKGNIEDVLLFLLFFPKVTSGPIVTWHKFIKAKQDKDISLNNTIIGLERIIIGLAKKVTIADVLGELVNTIVSSYSSSDRYTLILCALAYMFEIYYDFSGYSDIAIGISRIYGYKFNENFNFPYLSKTISEFWRRWHISLGNFFKEYVYIPLGGNKKHAYLNLFIIFLLSGIWHGNGIAYIVWGIILGIIVCLERFLSNNKLYNKIPNIFKWTTTMIIVYFSWIIFMTPSLSDAISYIKLIFINNNTNPFYTYMYYFDKRICFTLVIGIIGSLIGCDGISNRLINKINNNSYLSTIKYVVLIVIFIVSIIYIINSTYSPFLYFKF